MSDLRSIQVRQLNKVYKRIVTPRLNKLLEHYYGPIEIIVSDDVEEDVEDDTDDGEKIYVPEFEITVKLNDELKIPSSIGYSMGIILLNGATYVLSDHYILSLWFENDFGTYNNLKFYSTGEIYSDIDSFDAMDSYLKTHNN